ncbi:MULTISPECIES: hypothetical protein [Candidatus Accumulibacter]|uniref:Uncharacterized protein n=2 Tax=Candidatus Accumulibacter TaxID=327159 RepID=A0A080M5T2_9PROT|nr:MULTISPECIES: hypothetical protein [Candidatus Accumulibacter]KFB76642.1 MAG: hypothetical protein AW06_002282 [Candidatus Accumulibacter cognatus]MBL8402488.1 hypothetical protein [Accumulibacter sp.]QLH51229.1 MAG: hypothetical protein HWD57_16555 [Candidatus Accumulibacter cognatus]TMQ76919.1 hypothetical protein ACCUM_3792 [Candidatus Accumulibacter phosphatis]
MSTEERFGLIARYIRAASELTVQLGATGDEPFSLLLRAALDEAQRGAESSGSGQPCQGDDAHQPPGLYVAVSRRDSNDEIPF